MKKIYSIVITEQLQACADFYTSLFNFTIVFREPWYIHLVHESSGAELAFMVTQASNQPEELHMPYQGAGVVLSFEVEDAALEYRRLTESGQGRVFLPLRDEPWGQRHFMLRDPAGVCVDIVQQLTQS